ncbi:MAG: cupin domain-containing protein [Patescibacteria group bacterium]|nr:cupin domain-containing protein [Patescibacteria group bacterium]
MNINKIIDELKTKYPNKNILQNGSPVTEIVCEIDPASQHSDYSVAIAVAGKSAAHYHKKTTEIYEVIKGILNVYKNNQKIIVKKGQKITIEPGVVHWVEGKETWFRTTSSPGWIVEDHIMIK